MNEVCLQPPDGRLQISRLFNNHFHKDQENHTINGFYIDLKLSQETTQRN